MSIESNLCTWLKAIPAVAAAGARVFPVFAPEGTAAPYFIYRLMATPHAHNLSGRSVTAQPHFRITGWAATYEQALALASAILAAAEVRPITLTGAKALDVMDESDAFEPSPELLQYQFFGRHVDLRLTTT